MRTSKRIWRISAAIAASLCALYASISVTAAASLTEAQKIFIQENMLTAIAIDKCPGIGKDSVHSLDRLAAAHLDSEQLDSVDSYSEGLESQAEAMFNKDPEAFCATALQEFGPNGKKLLKLK